MFSQCHCTKIMTLPRCQGTRSSKQITKKNSQFSVSFSSTFLYCWFSRSGSFKVTKVTILYNFREILKSYFILPLFVYIPANLFDLIQKFIPVSCSSKNSLSFAHLLNFDNNWRRRLINLIGQYLCQTFLELIKMKNIPSFHRLWQLKPNRNSLFPINSKNSRLI